MTIALLSLAFLSQIQPNPQMVPKYMDGAIRKLVAGRSPATMTSELRAKLKDDLLADLGLSPQPARTPLNAKVTGTLARDGYRIEKIVYETYPKFYCTAYLYLPDKGAPPYPAVVCPVGHWRYKKLEPVVQARCVGLALLGFAVLCMDMPGHVGDNDDERNFPGSHSNWLLQMSSLPAAGPMVWDVVRGIDYLETRADIDKKRIGCTGASGGGLVAMYAGVIDDRIVCYAPTCFATSFEVNYQNGCYCNHVPGVMNIGDRSDVMALAAPKPVLLLGATEDGEFPAEGTRRSYEKLRAFYPGGAGCEMLLVEGVHDYSKPMREKMYGFMLKHLMGAAESGPKPEPRALPATRFAEAVNVEPPTASDSYCFPGGKAPADAKSLRQLAREKADELAARGGTLAELRERFAKVYPQPERLPIEAEVQLNPGTSAEQYVGSYLSEPGLRIPFTLFRRAGSGKQGVHIVIAQGGIADPDTNQPSDAGKRPFMEMRIDGRGFGSLQGLDMRLATYVGRPDVVMWAWDVSRAIDYLATRDDVDMANIEVWGFGPGAGQVPYLAALLDPRVKTAYGQRTMRSYLDAFERDDLPQFALPARILEVADLPLMRERTGPKRP